MDSKKNRIGNISDLLSDKLHTENMDRWLDFRTIVPLLGFQLLTSGNGTHRTLLILLYVVP